jgi:hypothetical protein
MIEDKKTLQLQFINSSRYTEDFLDFKGNFASKIMNPFKFQQTIKGSKFNSKTSYDVLINKPA